MHCTSVIVGCYEWAPVNLIHANDLMYEDGFGKACKGAGEPGLQPVAKCVQSRCVNTKEATGKSRQQWESEIGFRRSDAAAR